MQKQQQAGGAGPQDAEFDPSQMHGAGQQQNNTQQSDGPVDADFEVVDD
jgi:hypothetical protein